MKYSISKLHLQKYIHNTAVLNEILKYCTEFLSNHCECAASLDMNFTLETRRWKTIFFNHNARRVRREDRHEGF